MSEFMHQLGIDWRLLLSQAVNFGLLLLVLRLFVYKPLLKIMKERKERIEEGLAKAKEADKRLHEIDVIGKNRLRDAEREAFAIIRQGEAGAKLAEAKIMEEAKNKEKYLFESAQIVVARRKHEAEELLYKEVGELTKMIFAKTVEFDPRAVDERLISRAAREVMKKS